MINGPVTHQAAGVLSVAAVSGKKKKKKAKSLLTASNLSAASEPKPQ